MSSSEISTTDRLASGSRPERSREGPRVLRTSLTTRTTRSMAKARNEEQPEQNGEQGERHRVAGQTLKSDEQHIAETGEGYREGKDDPEQGLVLPSVEPRAGTADRPRLQGHENGIRRTAK